MTRRNGMTAAVAFGIAAGMVGMAFAAVPFYRWFCQTTGYGGTTQVATAKPVKVLDRKVTVQFNGDVNSDLPWSFKPAQREVTVRLGQETLAFFRARNNSSSTIVGTATFNVTPDKAGAYFDKIDCFCFTEQRLEPGQTADLPVTFFVDPDMAKDRGLDDVTTITLSYTFFRSLDEGKTGSAGKAAARADTLN